MTRKIVLLAAAAAAVAFAACGGSDDKAGATAVGAEAAKAGVEQAAHVKLTSESVPAEAREQGLQASFSNASTVAQDKQVVGLFVVKDAELAGDVSEQVRKSAPKAAKLIVDGNVLVVYAAAGDDRSAAVEKAVKAL
jgi:hypothetical protein